jgi:exo-1,4-beta-D-glucosaminidase
VSSNFYWLSTKKPEFDWEKTTYISTPIKTYEDMTSLAQLPKVRLDTVAHLRAAKEGDSVHVELKNTSKALALQVRLAVETGKAGDEVLPVLWEDNYISLLPGEERTIEARFPGKRGIGLHPTLKITGWNIEPQSIVLDEAKTGSSNPKKK